MTMDPFETLLELEEDFYREGYTAGTTDGYQAGLIEGKLFGIEKGYEKAREMGRLHGRAALWQNRISTTTSESDDKLPSVNVSGTSPSEEPPTVSTARIMELVANLPALSQNTRLQRHVDYILAVTSADMVDKHNSDEAVAAFDDHVAKAVAKAKIISSMTGEPLRVDISRRDGGPPLNGEQRNFNIEDADNMLGRH